jgi:hypothetical protein
VIFSSLSFFSFSFSFLSFLFFRSLFSTRLATAVVPGIRTGARGKGRQRRGQRVCLRPTCVGMNSFAGYQLPLSVKSVRPFHNMFVQMRANDTRGPARAGGTRARAGHRSLLQLDAGCQQSAARPPTSTCVRCRHNRQRAYTHTTGRVTGWVFEKNRPECGPALLFVEIDT